jgi:hypothetical protein
MTHAYSGSGRYPDRSSSALKSVVGAYFAWPRAERDLNSPRTKDKDAQYSPYAHSRRMAFSDGEVRGLPDDEASKSG